MTGRKSERTASTTSTKAGQFASRDSLNAGLLPENYIAMAEQITGGPASDVVTLSSP